MTEQREESIKKALEFCIEYFDKKEAIKRIITFIKDEEAINYSRCCKSDSEQLSKRPNTSSTWECFTKSEKQQKGNV